MEQIENILQDRLILLYFWKALLGYVRSVKNLGYYQYLMLELALAAMMFMDLDTWNLCFSCRLQQMKLHALKVMKGNEELSTAKTRQA